MSESPQQENSAFGTPDDESGSLRERVSQRMNSDPSGEEGEYGDWLASGPANHASNFFQQQQQRGLTLHHLDSQLVKDHLEKYLPTPSTRFHMMKERMEKELSELYIQLKQCRQMQGPEYDGKIKALEQRALLLQRNLFELDREISKLNPFLTFYKQIQKYSPAPFLRGANDAVWKWFPNPNRATQEMTTLNGELQSLQSLLENHLDDPSFSPQQMGRLVNQYDRNLKRIEKLAHELDNRETFRDKLNNQIQTLYRSWIYGEKSKISLDRKPQQ